MNFITEYAPGTAAVVPGKMSGDQTHFKATDGSLHVFVTSGLKSDDPDNAPCCCCSLRHQTCSGARCMPGTRDDKKSGYFRRCEDHDKHDQQKVQELLLRGTVVCQMGNDNDGCKYCNFLRDHNCPNRILLQTFMGDKAWDEVLDA